MERVWLNQYPPGVPTDIDPDQYPSLNAMFDEACAAYGNLPAYQNFGAILTYAQLDALSRAFAAWLQKKSGLVAGDRVALMMPNVLQYPVALFGILRAGMVVVNVNPLYTARELEHQLKDSGAKAIVIVENFAHMLQQVLPHTDLKQVLVTRIGDLLGFPRGVLVNLVLRPAQAGAALEHARQPSRSRRAGRRAGSQARRPCRRPAGHRVPAVHRRNHGRRQGGGAHPPQHGRERAAGERLDPAGAPGGTAENHHYRTAALSYLLADGELPPVRAARRENVLITNPRDFKGFVKELRKHKFFFISGVNTLFNALLHTPGFESLDFSSLKITLGGGMAVQAVVAARWKKVTGNVLTQAWGLTETSPAACINPMGVEFNGSIGLPIPSTDVSIRDDVGVEMRTNEVGEICVFGPQLMRGYWNRPDETEKVMFGDWLRTGDIGRMDAEGIRVHRGPQEGHDPRLRIQRLPERGRDRRGRASGGARGGGRGAARREFRAKSVALFVVKKDPSLTADALIEYCRANLTGYKVPKHVYFRTELPKTNVGKILRRALRDELRGGGVERCSTRRRSIPRSSGDVVAHRLDEDAHPLRIDTGGDAVTQIEYVPRPLAEALEHTLRRRAQRVAVARTARTDRGCPAGRRGPAPRGVRRPSPWSNRRPPRRIRSRRSLRAMRRRPW